MSPDMIRQELEAWIKRQREALPDRRVDWAHGAAETLEDLRREVDRMFGPQNADQPCERCAFIPTPDGKCICWEVAHVDGD